jgi:Rieske Fe-S protein
MTENAETIRAADRRTVLKGALVVGVAAPFLVACGSSDASNSANEPPASSGGGTSDAGSGGGSGSSGGAVLATTNDIPEGSGEIFHDDGIVVTQPKPGEFKGFTDICTHMGCPVHDVTSTINCNCHGSQYSITDGSVVTGPATQALAAKPIVVKGTNISLG